MGHRTLSLGLIFRALFLDSEAFDELRDDDNPFVEGLFLIVLIGLTTALLSLMGQFLAWASVPRVEMVRDIVLAAAEGPALVALAGRQPCVAGELSAYLGCGMAWLSCLVRRT